MKFLSQMCFSLGQMLFGLSDYWANIEMAEQHTRVDVAKEHARFRRLIAAGNPEAEGAYIQSAYRSLYELRADKERMAQTERSRSPRSRRHDGPLCEEWVPGEEVAF